MHGNARGDEYQANHHKSTVPCSQCQIHDEWRVTNDLIHHA